MNPGILKIGLERDEGREKCPVFQKANGEDKLQGGRSTGM